MDRRSRAIATLTAKRDRQAQALADYLSPLPEWFVGLIPHTVDELIGNAERDISFDLTLKRRKPYRHVRMYVALCDTVKLIHALECGEDVDAVLLHVLAGNP